MKDIETIVELVRAVRDAKTAGYEVEFDIQANHKAYDGFLVIIVRDTDPNSRVTGEWWFGAESEVMQVL